MLSRYKHFWQGNTFTNLYICKFANVLLLAPVIYCLLLPGNQLRAQQLPADSTAATAYQDTVFHIEQQRLLLAQSYQQATTDSARQAILHEAKSFLINTIDQKLFPFWYGTPWTFEGHTAIPNQGSIACGYFVSTLLEDLGFQVERIRMAQQASELIIKSLCSETNIKRFSNVSPETFTAAMQNSPDGLYIVGLDIHTGFILKYAGKIVFVHSSFLPPMTVVREPINTSEILSASRYRVIGNLSEDSTLLLKWLNRAQIQTRTN